MNDASQSMGDQILKKDLLPYCELDTLAMVKIYNHLITLTKNG